MRRVVMLVLCLVLSFCAFARGEAPKETDNRRGCLLFLNRSKPHQIIACDKDGNYLHRVRQVELWYQVGSNALPVVRLHSWDGIYPPDASLVEHEECLCLAQEIIDNDQFTAIISGSKATVPIAKGK